MNQLLKKEAYEARRALLLEQIFQKKGLTNFVLILMADFEDHRYDFRQESSFYYLSGIEEPGSVLLMQSDGHTSLFIPQYRADRAQWVSGSLVPAVAGVGDAFRFGIDEVLFAGHPWQSFSASLISNVSHYEQVIFALKQAVLSGKQICVVGSEATDLYATQHFIWKILEGAADITMYYEISDLLHQMRKTKDVDEIACLHEAVRLTAAAHEAVAKMLEPGVVEYELQSCIESVFLYFGSMGTAFPSIVAAGKNSTTLHYTARRSTVREGDIVLVDIGAMYGHYAADISRTYPASGLFTDRQAEVYNLVLQAQRYIEDHVKPGMYLFNPDQPEKSLHHIAVKFFEYRGCAQYFTHKIGHFLGLDVHDVGDVRAPLQEGDVITIEPGIYLQSEGIGIRIEDDYVVVQDGFVCLSDDIPKSIEEVEDLMNSAEREACDHV